jgi:hypothetical protein
MKRILVVILAGTLFGVVAVEGYSQVGFYLGGLGGVSTQKPSFDTASFDTNTTFLYGVRAGVQLLMFALEFNYYRAGHNVEMRDFFLFNWNGMENDTSYVGGNLRMMFPLAVFRPFLALGYGYYTFDVRNIDKDSEGGFNFGAGLEIKLGKLAIIGEGKYNRIAVNLNDFKVNLGQFTFTAGLNVYF